jgi:NADH-quinone oxidoreductase subunit M
MGYGYVAALGVILSAVYMLWMFQRVNYGEVLNEKNSHLPDLNVRERWMIWPAVAMAVFMGIAPKLFLVPMERSVERVVQRMQTAAPPVSVRRIDSAAPGTAQGSGRTDQGLASSGPSVSRVSEPAKAATVRPLSHQP